MCLGVRSPSGGEAGKEEGVIHELGPGVLGSVSRVEKAAGGCCAARDIWVVAVTGPAKKAHRPCPPPCPPPPADVLPQRGFQEDQLRRLQPWLCVFTRGGGCLRLPRSRRNQGDAGTLFVFTAPEAVFAFRCSGVLGPQDVSGIVLDLAQCLAHSRYSVSSLMINDTNN